MKSRSYWTAFLLIFIPSTTGLYHELSMKTFTVEDLRNDSYFGYSLTYQANRQILVVGAPKADKVGRVYEFNIAGNTSKQVEAPREITFTKETDNVNDTDFFLGASVKAGSDFYVMCSPRFIRTDLGDLQRMMTLGVCFVVPTYGDTRLLPDAALQSRFPISALESRMTSYGWSLDVTSTGQVIVGGPAMRQGRAKLYRRITNNDKPVPLLRNNLAKFSFGYSVAFGRYFDEDILKINYAVSTPYGLNGQGRVYFFDGATLKKEEFTITDDNIGSLFGAALCTVNLGDRRDSLLVGAPVFVEDSQCHDRGAVYIYIPAMGRALTNIKVIRGSSNGARFGSAIASLGDMDDDMKDEVAIGAPYEDDGRGAVYIYSGARLLDMNQQGDQMLIQRIQPADASLRYFGFSLTNLLDYDQNGCNELAVGAPGSNKAILYRCFSYITLNITTIFPADKQLGKNNNRDFIFQSCLNVQYAEKPLAIEANINVIVEIIHPNARLVSEDSRRVMKLMYQEQLSKKNTTYCRDIKIHAPLNGNYDQLLSYKISASLASDPQSSTDFKENRVLLSKQSILSIKGQESLADCVGESGKCEPELTVFYSSQIPNFYNVGSTNNGSFSFRIHNDGDTAYTACLVVRVEGARVLLIPNSCTYQAAEDILCTSKVQLPNGGDWEIGSITLDTSSLNSKSQSINIFYTLYNHCSSKSEETRRFRQEIVLITNSSLVKIKQESDPSSHINIYSEPSQVRHNFIITNDGQIDWVGVIIELDLTKKKFVKYSDLKINTHQEDDRICQVNDNGSGDDSLIKVSCTPLDLKRNSKVQVIIPFEITPFDDGDSDNEQNLKSVMRLLLKRNDIKTSSVTTTVQCKIDTVPLWIIITACIFGLIIVILFAYALSKLGVLRRKKREQLKNLKRSVHRQSIQRQSMRSRRSNKDEETLIPPPGISSTQEHEQEVS